MKPFAVSVTIGQKVTGKEFNTESEFKAFLQKAEELKQKAPTLLVKILRNGFPKVKKPAPVKTILDEAKEECMAWKRVMRDGVAMVDVDGKQLYKSVMVQTKPKVNYCPYCHGYKEFKNVDTGYDGSAKGCPDCGMTVNDFHMKTVNNLWKVKA